MADRAAVILRILGAASLAMGLLLAYNAMTTSPALYPPLLASYVIAAAVMGGAGFLTLISKYEE
ncbi:MAG TPA: hypothetical protein VMS77_00500 [Conexivisphaerales archaeon]|nr:hypothetical protein [Conexivisphaerales archaeon]